MEVKHRYRGRAVTDRDVAEIKQLIVRHPDLSRHALSRQLCEAWNWRQANGELRDMVCRSLMLQLHRAGLIELPPQRFRPPNNVIARAAPTGVAVDKSQVRRTLRELEPVEIRSVRRTADEPLFKALIQEYHYLGYTRPVGEHLKYLVYFGERPIACLAWSSAPRHLGPRDRYIGWSPEVRRRNLHFIAYNTRYLILPWIEVPNLASYLLGRMAREISRDWERVYGHPIYFLETFITPERFRGTCYRAANWISLGRTTGRGKWDHTRKANRPLKEILGYPLSRRFRKLLRGEG
jgi:hypothetical protein